MKGFELLSLNPNEVKVHLAVNSSDGYDSPLNVFYDGKFKEWQEVQTKKNFQRKYILSIIRYQRNDLWLFAGVYEVIDVKPNENGSYQYTSILTKVGNDLIGRLILHYQVTSRAMYRNAETICDSLNLYEIKSVPLCFSDFTNYKEVLLSRNQLEIMYRQVPASWKTALSSVAGVYLQTDLRNGKHYVGSAYGFGGFWQRWESYFITFHGGNKGLLDLYKGEGKGVFDNFQYSILETVDIDTPKEEVIAIENRWKKQLQSKEFGYNEN